LIASIASTAMIGGDRPSRDRGPYFR